MALRRLRGAGNDEGPLREVIEAAGLGAKKNNRVDLAAVSPTGELVAIFEVKTGLDWGSIYGAIGQLMYYGKTGAHNPERLVAVFPGGGPADLDARLGESGSTSPSRHSGRRCVVGRPRATRS